MEYWGFVYPMTSFATNAPTLRNKSEVFASRYEGLSGGYTSFFRRTLQMEKDQFQYGMDSLRPLECVAIPDPDGVQAFIGARQAGIGDMIKENRKAVTGGHLVAKLNGDAEQDP